jgi:hypothetical protein
MIEADQTVRAPDPKGRPLPEARTVSPEAAPGNGG